MPWRALRVLPSPPSTQCAPEPTEHAERALCRTELPEAPLVQRYVEVYTVFRACVDSNACTNRDD